MKKILVSLLFLGLSAVGGQAQNGANVRQSGNVTPGHVPMWTTNGVIQDGGTASQGFLSSIGVTAQGPGICQNSAPITGPYNRLCLSVSTGSAASISLQNLGGATAQALNFIVNGTTFSINATLPVPIASSILTTDTMGVVAWTQMLPPILGTVTITPPALSTTKGLAITQTPAGTITPSIFPADYALNYINVPTDTVNMGDGNELTAFAIVRKSGGSTVLGQRSGLHVEQWLTSAMNGAATQRDIVGATIQVFGQVGNSGGGFFGVNPVAYLVAGATGAGFLAGEEIDVAVQAGASVLNKHGSWVVLAGTDAVQGSVIDAAYRMTNSGSVGWKTGFLADSGTISAGGTVFDASSVSSGVAYLLRGPSGFAVTGIADVLAKSITLTSAINNPGVVFTDGTVAGVIRPDAAYTHSILFGTTNNFTVGVLVNNTVRAAFIGDVFWSGVGGAIGNIGLQGTLGCIEFFGTTNGIASICAQAVAGTPTLTIGTTSGTILTTGSALNLVVGTTTISSGTTLRVLYDNAGVLGEYTNTQLTALVNIATASLNGALPAWPGNTTTFFRGDGTYTAVAISGVSGLGTGVATALAINVGSAGAFVAFNGALGTPSSGVGTNITNVNAATLGGATFAAPGAIGGGTPAVGTFTVLTGTSGNITGLSNFALRDTSAAFDVTIVATSSVVLSAGRTLTLNMGNVAHTLAFGTTANTITFPNTASDTVAMLAVANNFSAVNTFSNATDSTTTTTGGALFSGGIGVVKSASIGGSVGVGGPPITGRTLTVTFNQPTFGFLDTAGTATFKMIGLVYDGKNTLTQPGLAWQNLGDTGTFVSNSGVIWRDGAMTLGSITYPGEAGSLRIEAQIYQPSITTTSTAQTGTVCWTTGTGKYTVDTTTTCLLSDEEQKHNIQPLKNVLAKVLKFEALSYEYNELVQGEQVGFTAQRMAKIDDRLVSYCDGKPCRVRYQQAGAFFAGAIQEFYAEFQVDFQHLKTDNDNLRAANDNLVTRVQELEAKVR